MKLRQAVVAEFLGTFMFFFAGIAAILGSTPAVGNGVGLIGIALAHGLGLSIAVNAFGGVSGAHFNPAVTLAMMVTRRAAGVSAALVCRAIFPPAAVAQANLGIPLPAAWATTPVILGAECVMTFLLVIAIFGTAVDTRGAGVKIGGFGIGLAVAIDILAGGPVTGASMNPARSFGPALVQGYWNFHWMYWVAPAAGAVVAALVYDNLILDKGAR
jgi:MIP family channel proteins